MKTVEAIAKVISVVKGVTKDHEVGEGYISYKARNIEDVITAIRSSCAANGLIIYPSKIDTNVFTEVRVGKKGERVVQICDATVEYTLSTGGDSIIAVGIGRGEDSGDKAPNKAMTFAYKNVLLQTFMLATDDPDMTVSEENMLPNGVAKKERLAEITRMAKDLTSYERQALTKWRVESSLSNLKYGELLESDVDVYLDKLNEIYDQRPSAGEIEQDVED